MSGITGILVIVFSITLFLLGIAPLVSLLPVAVYVVVALSFYTYHFLRAPKALDTNLREQLRLAQVAKQAEIDGLQEAHKTDLSNLESNLTAEFKLEIEKLQDQINSLYEKYRVRMQAHRKHYNSEVSKLRSQVSDQSKQIQELSGPTLVFQVERCPYCSITLSHEQYTFDPPGGEPREVDSYMINATVQIRFQNHSLYQTMLTKGMEASLVRKTRNGKEKAIPLLQATTIVAGEGSPVLDKLEEIRFEPTSKTKSYVVSFGMELLTRYGKRLNQNCFIRITMEAMRQPPCYVDLVVNWEDALSGRAAVTPRTSAECQAHK